METFDLKKFLIENKLTTNSKIISNLENVGTCNTTDDFLEGKVSLKEFTEYLNSIEKEVLLLLEQEDIQGAQSVAQKVFASFSSFAKTITSNIRRFSISLANKIVAGLKGLLRFFSIFQKRFPKLFKILVAFAVIIIALAFIGVTTAAAANPDMAFTPAQLDAMVGLLRQLASESSGVDISSIMEAIIYLQDSKDAVLDIKDYSEAAVNMANAAKEVFSGLQTEMRSEDAAIAQNAFNTLEAALEAGTDYVVKFGKGVKIGPDGKPML